MQSLILHCTSVAARRDALGMVALRGTNTPTVCIVEKKVSMHVEPGPITDTRKHIWEALVATCALQERLALHGAVGAT